MNNMKLPEWVKVPPRIQATLVKQEWSGHKKGYASPVGEERIDVTDRLLRLHAEDIRLLQDDTYESDTLVEGRHGHEGPFAVRVEVELDSFLELYGLDKRAMLTESQLDQLRGVYGVHPGDNDRAELLWHTVLCYRLDMEAASNVDHSIQGMLKKIMHGPAVVVTAVLSKKYNETGLVFTWVPVTETEAVELYDEARDEEFAEAGVGKECVNAI